MKLKMAIATKRTLLANEPLLRPGVWHIDDRVLFSAAAATNRLKETLCRDPSGRSGKADAGGRSLRRTGLSLLALDRGTVRNGAKSFDGTLVYINRNRQTKIFDFQSGTVLTTTTPDEWARYAQARSLALFDHFSIPKARLIEKEGRLFREEQILDGQPVASLPAAEQTEVFARIIEQYGRYVEQCRKPPRTDIVMQSFRQIRDIVSQPARDVFDRLEGPVTDFAERCGFVEGHLDLNVANVLYDGDLHLLDIDDAGLEVPCLYDINNLALNEIYQNRSGALLRELMGPGLQDSIVDLGRRGIAAFTPADIGISIFVNFFMTHASYLYEHVCKRPVVARAVEQRWIAFSEALANSNQRI